MVQGGFAEVHEKMGPRFCRCLSQDGPEVLPGLTESLRGRSEVWEVDQGVGRGSC